MACLGVVWFSPLVLCLLLFVPSPVGLSLSSIALCQWAQEWWVMTNAETALMSLMLNAMFAQEVARPSRVVLLVAVDAVYPFVFLVDVGNELLNPLHVVVILLVAVLRSGLVDWALLILSLRKEVGGVEVGRVQLVPLQWSFYWRCAAVHAAVVPIAKVLLVLPWQVA